MNNSVNFETVTYTHVKDNRTEGSRVFSAAMDMMRTEGGVDGLLEAIDERAKAGTRGYKDSINEIKAEAKRKKQFFREKGRSVAIVDMLREGIDCCTLCTSFDPEFSF